MEPGYAHELPCSLPVNIIKNPAFFRSEIRSKALWRDWCPPAAPVIKISPMISECKLRLSSHLRDLASHRTMSTIRFALSFDLHSIPIFYCYPCIPAAYLFSTSIWLSQYICSIYPVFARLDRRSHYTRFGSSPPSDHFLENVDIMRPNIIYNAYTENHNGRPIALDTVWKLLKHPQNLWTTYFHDRTV